MHEYTTYPYIIMSSIIVSQVSGLARDMSVLQQTVKRMEKSIERIEAVASPEQAEQMRQLVQIVKADVSGMDEKMVMHQKQLERYVDTVDRSAREEAKKDLQREKMLLETLLTQKLEQNLIKVLKSKMEDIQKDIQSVRSEMDTKVLDIQKALEAILREQASGGEADTEADIEIEGEATYVEGDVHGGEATNHGNAEVGIETESTAELAAASSSPPRRYPVHDVAGLLSRHQTFRPALILPIYFDHSC